MADIVLTCPKCSNQATISEHIAQKAIPCPACGEAIPVPERKKPATLILKREKTRNTPSTIFTRLSSTAEAREAVLVKPSAKKPQFLARDLRRVKRHKVIRGLGWLAFGMLTIACGYFRFVHQPPQLPLATVKLYGMIAIGIVYLLCILLALKDNMFDGLLAIVVPMYPFYYIFFVSGAVFVRALAGALLIAFGLDLLLVIQVEFRELVDKINYWLRHA